MNCQILTKTSAFGALSLLCACASGPQKVAFPVGTDPEAKLTELRGRLDRDQAKQYSHFSPSDFELAQRFLTEAQDRFDANEDNESVLEDAGYAQAKLQSVEDYATLHQGETAAIGTDARQIVQFNTTTNEKVNAL